MLFKAPRLKKKKTPRNNQNKKTQPLSYSTFIDGENWDRVQSHSPRSHGVSDRFPLGKQGPSPRARHFFGVTGGRHPGYKTSQGAHERNIAQSSLLCWTAKRSQVRHTRILFCWLEVNCIQRESGQPQSHLLTSALTALSAMDFNQVLCTRSWFLQACSCLTLEVQIPARC